MMYTVQFRCFPNRTQRGACLATFAVLADAIASGLTDGEAFDVSAPSGAIVWAWEERS